MATKNLYLIIATDVGKSYECGLDVKTHQLSLASAAEIIPGIYEYKINPHPALLDGKTAVILKASDFDMPDAREVNGKIKITIFTCHPEQWKSELKKTFAEDNF